MQIVGAFIFGAAWLWTHRQPRKGWMYFVIGIVLIAALATMPNQQ